MAIVNIYVSVNTNLTHGLFWRALRGRLLYLITLLDLSIWFPLYLHTTGQTTSDEAERRGEEFDWDFWEIFQIPDSNTLTVRDTRISLPVFVQEFRKFFTASVWRIPRVLVRANDLLTGPQVSLPAQFTGRSATHWWVSAKIFLLVSLCALGSVLRLSCTRWCTRLLYIKPRALDYRVLGYRTFGEHSMTIHSV